MIFFLKIGLIREWQKEFLEFGSGKLEKICEKILLEFFLKSSKGNFKDKFKENFKKNSKENFKENSIKFAGNSKEFCAKFCQISPISTPIK